ncbi:hypothetical protein, partial [Pseudophaeobacter profundi]|uniref:hypothetical protein n=1 Tax=Pseudophaeobacter profundi TaxID=3034152 RepID=UPI00243011DF
MTTLGMEATDMVMAMEDMISLTVQDMVPQLPEVEGEKIRVRVDYFAQRHIESFQSSSVMWLQIICKMTALGSAL